MTLDAARRIAGRVSAALAHDRVARRLAIAGTPIELTASSDVADAVLAPFEHLQTSDDGDVALRIAIAQMQDGDVDDDLSDSGVVLVEERTVVHLNPHSAAVLDRAAGTIHALVRTDGGVAPWVRAKPLQVPLSIFFADRGVDLLHSALVSRNGDGILITGNSGCGKSTLAIAALDAGFDFLGDDCVAVDGMRGHSIFGCGCLDRGGDEKEVVPIARMHAARIATSTTIRAIVLPRVTHGDVVLSRAAGRDALLALAPGSILKRAVPPAAALARMAQLARSVPVYRLEMGAIGDAVTKLGEVLQCLRT